jgi:hypothetical protein
MILKDKVHKYIAGGLKGAKSLKNFSLSLDGRG